MTETLQGRIERAGWVVSGDGAHWRIQWPWVPELAATGSSLVQASKRLARHLRSRADDIDLMLKGIDP